MSIPLPRGGCDTRSDFKWNVTGFEFRILILIVCCFINANNKMCPTIYPLMRREHMDLNPGCKYYSLYNTPGFGFFAEEQLILFNP